MAKTNKPQEVLVQAYDYTLKQEYYKIIQGFFFSHDRLIRADTCKEWKQWNIRCDDLPNKILVNGKEYELIEKNVKD